MSQTPTEAPALSVESLAHFLRMPSVKDEDEADLQEVLDASIDRVRDMVAVGLDGSDEVTYRPTPNQRGALMFPSGANELVSVTTPSGDDVATDRLTIVDLDAGIIWPSTRNYRPGAYTIVVRRPGAGAAVTLAVKIIAKHLWGVHRGSGGREGPRGGVIAQDEAALAGFAIPRRARELLEPYLTQGGFA